MINLEWVSDYIDIKDENLKELAKKITCNNRHKLATIMNEEFNETRYNELIKDNYFFIGWYVWISVLKISMWDLEQLSFGK